MRLLLVEDDKKIATFVVKGLRQDNHTVDWAVNGEDGLELAAVHPYDAMVIDVMLPKRDGLSLIGELRRLGKHTPILILSAKSSVDDRVKGLETGADDYLAKPFSFAELLARLQALVRRAARGTENTSLLQYQDLEMDLMTRRVMRGGKTIDMQAKEFALLEYFLRNPGRVLTKTMILEHIYDYAFDPQTNVVDVLVCRLRQKVDRDFSVKLIQTLRGMGYVLRES